MHFRLLLDDKGCLRSEDGQLILWRDGFTLRREGENIEVIDDHGQLVARVGERMIGGGGEVPLTVIPGLPLEDCPTEKYWQLGEIKPLP